jgi:hypothetical protein
MWMALATVLASALADGQAPSGDLSCPDPAEIESQLIRMGGTGNARPEIVITGDRMRVLLRGPDGETLGSREVEAPSSCSERATVAAVLVATWMGVWPQAAKPATAAPESPTSPAPTPSGSDGQGFGIGLALASGFDGNAFAWGIATQMNGRLYGPLRGFVGLSAFTSRDQSIGPGYASYTRPALEAGPSLRLGQGRIQGEIGLGGRLGLLVLRGKSLTTTHWTTRTVPGASAWLSLLLAGKSFSPFVTVGGIYWFGQETATLDDSDATTTLPSWDAQLGLGVLWGLR